MYARIAARYLRRFQIKRGQLARPAESLTVRNDLGNHPPFIRSTRREGLWVEQERLCPSRSSAIAPRGKNAIAGHNTRGEVAYVLERRTLGRNNDVGQERVLRMDMGTSLDGCNDRHANVGYVFQDLSALVMGLAPYAGIGNVAERRPIHADHKVPSRPREDYDLIRSILGNPVEGVNNFRVGLCRESERSSIVMELYDQHAFVVSRQLHVAVSGEIVISI